MLCCVFTMYLFCLSVPRWNSLLTLWPCWSLCLKCLPFNPFEIPINSSGFFKVQSCPTPVGRLKYSLYLYTLGHCVVIVLLSCCELLEGKKRVLVILFLLLRHSFFFSRFYLFTFRERGREGEREGEKHRSVASRMPPAGDLAHNPDMCLDWELNLGPLGS